MRTPRIHTLTIAALAAGCGLGLAACGQASPPAAPLSPTTVTASAAASTISLKSIAVTPGQLGTGFVEKLLPDGNRVTDVVTLDLCGQAFASESLRQQRLQLIYGVPRSKTLVSNEVVRYAAGGVAAARAELKRVAASCPTGPQHGTVQGEKGISYRVSVVHFPGTLTDALALKVHESRGKLHVTQFAVYQFDGDYMSGDYGVGDNLSAQRALVAKAAAATATNLKRGLG